MNPSTGRPTNNIYAGRRYPSGGIVVTRGGLLLEPAPPDRYPQDLTTPCSWGTDCEGADRLALAILHDVMPDRPVMVRGLCRRYAVEVVAKWRSEWFVTTSACVLQWVNEQPDYLFLLAAQVAEGGEP